MAARRDRRLGLSAAEHQAAGAAGHARRRRVPAGRHRRGLLAAPAGAELRGGDRLSGRGGRRGHRGSRPRGRNAARRRRAGGDLGGPAQRGLDGGAARARARQCGGHEPCRAALVGTAAALHAGDGDRRAPCDACLAGIGGRAPGDFPRGRAFRTDRHDRRSLPAFSHRPRCAGRLGHRGLRGSIRGLYPVGVGAQSAAQDQATGESGMDLGLRPEFQERLDRVAAMVRDEIAPCEAEFHAEVGRGDRWALSQRQSEILEGLKARARAEGLWNLWLTEDGGAGLRTVDYAYFAEVMGRSPLAPEVFNCNAPDTGNMEVFHRYGSPEMQARWLKPLMEGEIRSAYLMTEPGVASSDATNISMSCVRDGDAWVLDGEKWWATGAGDPRCAVYIVMVRTGGEDAPKHQRHSMIVVPADSPGIEVLRAMQVYGHDDAPHGHMHIRFSGVRVPAESILLGEGRGFEIAQGRLGPGRIHHCMRAIGMAEAALEMMCRRSLSREAFGKPLAQLGANYDIIAEARMEIEQARLLCLKAAWMMDQGDPRAAAPWIHQIKVVAPRVALRVVDEAVQMFGAQGISQDVPLAEMWTHLRTLRLADGPDAVHRRQVARAELRRHTQEKV